MFFFSANLLNQSDFRILSDFLPGGSYHDIAELLPNSIAPLRSKRIGLYSIIRDGVSFNRRSKTSKSWRCSRRAQNCSATYLISGNGHFVKGQEHNAACRKLSKNSAPSRKISTRAKQKYWA